MEETNKTAITTNEEKETFKNLCTEVFPLVQKISDMVKDSGIARSAYITIGENGYLIMSFAGTTWEAVKYGPDNKAVMRYDYSETLDI